MGNYLTKVFNFFGFKEEARIIMVGLDAAGKTSILFQLKLAQYVRTTTPTVGFNVEVVDVKDLRFTIWDVGGQRNLRELWHLYFQNARGIIFVVDASDQKRLCEAAMEMHSLLSRPELKDCVLLVLANKQDLSHVIGIDDLVHYLGLYDIEQDWHIQATSAKTGKGIKRGFQTLRDMMMEQRNRRKNYVFH